MSGDDGLNAHAIAFNIQSDTQGYAYVHTNTNWNRVMRWYAIDFGSRAGSRQEGTVDNSSDTNWATAAQTLSPAIPVDRGWSMASITSNGDGTAFPRPCARHWLSDATTLEIEHMRTGQPSWIEWQVLELPYPTPTPTPSPSPTATATPTATPTRTPPPSPSPTPVDLPPPWLHQDVGGVGVAGDASYSSGTFTIDGDGADIWGTADAFHFVYQSLSGDGEIYARVASVENTDPWAKAGVMIREELTAGSTHAMSVVTVGNGIAFQRRTVTDGVSDHTAGGAYSAPYWVRLVRSGDTFTGYESPDGSSWTEIDSATISMSTDVYIGLAVTSHNGSELCTSGIDNVTVITPPPSPTPSPSVTPTAIPSPTSPVEVLLSVADSYVNQNAANTNYGTATTMEVRSTSGGTPDRNRRSFVQFDVSSIPAGATIQSATVRLYMETAPSGSRSYDINRVTASWIESGAGGITWNNQPAVAGSPTDTIATGTAAGVWLEWDVTCDVQGYVSGTHSNYGWRVKDQTESSATDYRSVFRTREYTGTTYDPQLVVIYVVPTPTPTATPTPSPSPTITPTPVGFQTPSPTPSVTPSPTPSPSVTPTAAPSPTAPLEVLLSVADSYVNQNSGNTNYGTNTTMLVRSTTAGTPNANNRSFVQFDVSSIPAGATIQTATVRLYLQTAPTASRNYDMNRATASWVESGAGGITWNNQPAVAASATSTIATGTASGVWLEWDATSDVQGFISGTYSNYGWRVMDQVENSATDRQSTFRTREYAGTAYDPQLVVIYVVPTPTPTATPTPTVTPPPTVTPTPTPYGYKTPSPTPSITPSPSVTPTPVGYKTPSPTPAASPTVTPERVIVGKGYATYYVMGEEEQLMNVYKQIPISGVNPAWTGANMNSRVSLVATGDDVQVFLDEWENGYTYDQSDPYNTSDARWCRADGTELNAGDVLDLTNDDTFVPGSQGVDAGDVLHVTNAPLNIVRTMWPDYPPGTYMAGSWELYPIQHWENEYTVPVGADTRPALLPFEYTYLFVQGFSNRHPGSDRRSLLRRGMGGGHGDR